MRSLRALKSATSVPDADASRGIEAQDVNIITLADKNRKATVFPEQVGPENKETNTAKDFEAKIMEKIQPIAYIPVIVSVLNKQQGAQAIERPLKCTTTSAAKSQPAERHHVEGD
jgi:GTP-binding protein